MAYRGLKTRNWQEDTCVEVMTKCFNYLQNELGTDTDIEFGRTAFWGKDAFHSGVYVHRQRKQNHYVCLNFRNLYGFDFKTILEVLGHEMRHAYQDKQGWFDAPENSFGRRIQQKMGGVESGWWKNEYISRVAYKDLPWEIDAREYQGKYAQLCIDAGVITEEELELKLQGDKTQKPLERETFKWIEDNYPNSTIVDAYTETFEEWEERCKQAMQETKDKLTALGFKLVNNTWLFKGKSQAKLTKKEAIEAREAHRAVKSQKIKINPRPRRKVSKEGIAYVTEQQYNDYLDKATKLFKKGIARNSEEMYDLYTELEELRTFVPYKKKTLTVEDLVC